MVQSLGISTLLCALFWATLYTIGQPPAYSLVMLLVSFVFYTQFRALTPRAYSVYAFLLLLSLLNFDLASLKLKSIHILLLLAMAALSKWLARGPRFFRHPLFLFSALYLGLPYLARAVGSEAIRTPLLIANLSFWCFVFLVKDDRFAPSGIFDRVGFLLPMPMFLGDSITMPYFLGPKAFTEYAHPETRHEDRRRTVTFLALNLLVAGILAGLEKSFPSALHRDPHAEFFQWRIGWGAYLGYGALSVVDIYVKLFIRVNIGVGILRIGGLRFPAANSTRLFKSGDFFDFFGGIHFYVKELYSELFFYPIFLGLRGIKSASLRACISAFSAVMIGGLLLHSFFLYSEMIARGTFSFFRDFPATWLGELPVASAIAIALAARWRNRRSLGDVARVPKTASRLFHGGRILFYFLVFMAADFVEFWPGGAPVTTLILFFQQRIQ